VQAFEVLEIAVEERVLVVPLDLERDDAVLVSPDVVDLVRDRLALDVVDGLADREDGLGPAELSERAAQALGAGSGW
jgi:hypothetical protein